MSSFMAFNCHPNSMVRYLCTRRLCFQDNSHFSSSCAGILRSLTLSPRPWPSFVRCSQSPVVSSSSGCNTFMEVVKSIARKASASTEKIALRADQKSYSYTQLISAAKRISTLLCDGGLKSVDGIRGNKHLGGTRIGIVAKPSAEFVAGILGTWFSGGVAVPLAISYPEAELLHVINDSDVSIILSTEDHQELVQNVVAKTTVQFSVIPPVPSITAQTTHFQSQTEDHSGVHSSMGIESSMEMEGDNPALILYTSGTTGKPKGVVHTHKGILAQVQMLVNAWEYAASDQFLNCLPLHHVHGLFNALFAPLYAGSTVEFMPKFSVRGIWQKWRESYPQDGTKVANAVTVFTGVPTMYTRLLQGYESMDPELRYASASAARQLRLMMCGSSALPLPIMEQWEKITGHRLLERYGMTEFVMAISNSLRGERKAGTIGKPFPGVQAKILPEDGSGDGTTGVGELYIKSPSLFKEYWKCPEITKESFIEGGFFKTGDAARVDEDGYYVILGRTNADIMKVGGYKLSALEIEAVLLKHPAVVECYVLGLPDKDYGEVVTAVVVPEKETKRKQEEELKPALSLEELSNWAKEKLAPYKIPTRLILMDRVPRNAMGKVNKKEMKKTLAAEVR